MDVELNFRGCPLPHEFRAVQRDEGSAESDHDDNCRLLTHLNSRVPVAVPLTRSLVLWSPRRVLDGIPLEFSPEI